MSHGYESGRLNLPFVGISTILAAQILLNTIGRTAHNAKR
jgi:hypothetical protein